MFYLVEPLIFNDLQDRPFLGCAMVMGALRRQNVSARLITGQTWILEYIFGEGRQIFISQMKTLFDEEQADPFLKKHWLMSDAELESIFQDLYRKMRLMSARDYFDASFLNTISFWLRLFYLVEVNLINQSNHPSQFIKQFCRRILVDQESPVVGFSVNLGVDPVTAAIIQYLRKHSDVRVVLGGSPFAHMPQESLSVILDQFADYLVVGPADEMIVDFLDMLDSGASPEKIPNLVYKMEDRYVFNPVDCVGDLNTLPYPDFSQFDLDQYLTPERILPLQTSRGCHWGKCAFCQHPIGNFLTYQTMKPENVVALMTHLQETYQAHHFSFNDSDVPFSRAKRISEAILGSQLKDQVSIYMYCRFDARFNDLDFMSLIKKAGVHSIHWGMESSNQRVLDLMNKGIDAKNVKPILQKAAEVGIANQIFAFFGFPGETMAEAQETADFLVDNAAYLETSIQAAAGVFVLAKGSDIYTHPEKFGIKILEDGQYQVKSGLSNQQAIEFSRKFKKRIQFSKKQLSGQRLKFTTNTNIARMKYFLCAAHGQYTASAAEKQLRDGALNQIVPLFGGRLMDDDQYLPVNFTESPQVNAIGQPSPVTLSDLERHLFVMANGEQTLSQILTQIELVLDLPKEDIRQKAIDFFSSALASGWALAFSKPWKSTFTRSGELCE